MCGHCVLVPRRRCAEAMIELRKTVLDGEPTTQQILSYGPLVSEIREIEKVLKGEWSQWTLHYRTPPPPPGPQMPTGALPLPHPLVPTPAEHLMGRSATRASYVTPSETRWCKLYARPGVAPPTNPLGPRVDPSTTLQISLF
jgi:hypothetical protein